MRKPARKPGAFLNRALITALLGLLKIFTIGGGQRAAFGLLD